MRHEGDLVLEGIYPGGVYTHLLTTRHAGVMQSPRFEIESDYISVKVLGGGLQLRPSHRRELSAARRRDLSPALQPPAATGCSGRSGRRSSGRASPATSRVHDAGGLDQLRAGPRSTPGRSPVPNGRSMAGRLSARRRSRSIPRLVSRGRPSSRSSTSSTPRRRIRRPTFRRSSPDSLRVAAAGLARRSARRAPGGVPGLFRPDWTVAERDGPDPGNPAAHRGVQASGGRGPLCPAGFPGIVEESSPDQPPAGSRRPRETGRSGAQAAAEGAGREGIREPAHSAAAPCGGDGEPPRNPLAARVMANRIWGRLFGRGIVATPDNFGALGERPLASGASRLRRRNFRRRRVVDQGTGRDARHPPARTGWAAPRLPRHSNSIRRTPLLQHMPVRRLEAEAIRDAVLAVSGRLDTAMFGGRARAGRNVRGAPRGRRVRVRGRSKERLPADPPQTRTNPFLEVFDQPTPSTTRGPEGRDERAGPVPGDDEQPFRPELGRGMGPASRGGRGATRWNPRVSYMYAKALGRPPTSRERSDRRGVRRGPCSGGGPGRAQRPSGSRRCGSALHNALFNFKEFIYVR